MSLTMVCVALTWAGVAGGNQGSAAVEMKPAAITLEAPPAVDTPRSCVLRGRGGSVNILSVAASDPAITVDLREDLQAGTYVVTATLPAGYPVTAGREPVYVLVQTDQSEEPLGVQPKALKTDRLPATGRPVAVPGEAGPTTLKSDRLEAGPTLVWGLAWGDS